MSPAPEQIFPSPLLPKGGEGPDLAEALAWLDYCLGEAEAAMQAVKAAAVRAPGMTCLNYHALCEMAAVIVNLRGRCARLGSQGDG